MSRGPEPNKDIPTGTFSLTGTLRATAPAVSPAPLQIRFLQQLSIMSSSQKELHYDSEIFKSPELKLELKWWIENLRISEGNPIHLPPPELTICSDAARTGGWGAVCHLGSTGGQWNAEERLLNINLKEVSKRIWEYLLEHQITITAEWIPSHLNTIADWESRNVRDSSEWKLCPKIFHCLSRRWGRPEVDLFASRISHQLDRYVSWKPDPDCVGVNAFTQKWGQIFPYAFPPFCLITRVLRQTTSQDVNKMVLIAPIWPTQPWYPVLLSMLIDIPVLLPQSPHLLSSPEGQAHPLLVEGSLPLAAWLVSGRDTKQREFLRRLQNSCFMPGDRVPQKLMNQPLWCGKRSVNPFKCPVKD